MMYRFIYQELSGAGEKERVEQQGSRGGSDHQGKYWGESIQACDAKIMR